MKIEDVLERTTFDLPIYVMDYRAIYAPNVKEMMLRSMAGMLPGMACSHARDQYRYDSRYNMQYSDKLCEIRWMYGSNQERSK